jgi:photosystem II stability/assembly factor-like uncharacterized protein
MKTVFRFFFAIIFGFTDVYLLPAQWIQTTLNDAQITSFAISGTDLFAGNYNGGLFLSTDIGTSWSPVTSGLTDTIVRSLRVNGTDLFAGTHNGVYLSTNSGTSWTPVNSGMTNTQVTSLVFCGTNLFAGTWGNGVYLSTDNGTSWSPVTSGLTNLNIFSVVVRDTTLFAGTYGGGVFLSTDKGANWTTANSGLKSLCVFSLIVSGSNLFAGSDSGVALSTNNGTSWIAANSGLTNLHVFSFAVHGVNLFAGTNDGVFLSTDNGTNWTAINSGLGINSYVRPLAVSEPYLLAGTSSNGVWRRPLSEITAVKGISNGLPANFSLEQNYPNPFNPSTVISYRLPGNSFVTLKIFDALGREIQTLVNGMQNYGDHSVVFNTGNLSSGIYFYRIQAGTYSETKKLVLLR